jgi:hypothetical protein
MSERPPADALLPAMLDEQGRLRLIARQMLIADLRCPKGHLLALVVGTKHGPWAAWRVAGHPWSCEWVRFPSDPDMTLLQAVGCRCRSAGGQRLWKVPMHWLAVQRGTVLPPPLPYRFRPDDADGNRVG